MNTTTASFVNLKTMDGPEIYWKLLEILKGTDHEEDKSVTAVAV